MAGCPLSITHHRSVFRMVIQAFWLECDFFINFDSVSFMWCAKFRAQTTWGDDMNKVGAIDE